MLHRNLLATLACLALPFFTAAQEAELVLEDSSGLHEVAGERLLELRGIHGTISVRLGAAGRLVFEGRTLDKSREHVAAALWREGGKLILAPGSEMPAEGMLIDIAVPPSVRVVVNASDSRLQLSGLGDDVRVSGSGLDVKARGLRAGGEFKLKKSDLSVQGIVDLTVSNSDGKNDIEHVTGSVDIDVRGGKLKLASSDLGGIVYGEETEMAFSLVHGELEVEAVGGSVLLHGCDGGARLQAEGSAVTLRQNKERVEVRSDAAITIAEHEGPIDVFAFGSEIRASKVNGPLMIENHDAAVVLEETTGTLAVRGGGLKVQVTNPKGEVELRLTGSDVQVSGAREGLQVQNDYGDVNVIGATGRVRVQSSGGNINASALEASVEIAANGPQVSASWKRLIAAEQSSIRNEGGDVIVALPPRERCIIKADAPYGRIESELPGFEVDGDGKRAAGEYTAGGQPAPQVKKAVLEIEAGGDVYLGVFDKSGG